MACRPPIVSPSFTSGVSFSISPRTSSGLIYSRTRNRSAAAAGTPRTPADCGFGRRFPAAAASRPTSPQRRSPTLGSKPAAQRPDNKQRRALHSASSLPPATSSTTPRPDPPSLLQTTDPRPTPPLPSALLAPPRLPEPIVEPIDDLHSVLASSTKHTPTARAKSTLSPSAPPPSGSSPWVHIRRHRPLGPHSIDWSPTSCGGPTPRRTKPATHYRRQTPSFSCTDLTRTHCAMPAIYQPRPLSHPPASMFQC